jgi:hypothetical protein
MPAALRRAFFEGDVQLVISSINIPAKLDRPIVLLPSRAVEDIDGNCPLEHERTLSVFIDLSQYFFF